MKAIRGRSRRRNKTMDTETTSRAGTSIRFEDSIEEDNVLDNLSKCLFCRNECERDYGVEYLQGHAHKIITRENKTEQNLHGVPNGLIGHHIQSIFVLEKMLGYPKDKCYQYLQRYSTLHPGLWFSICSTCRETVDKCYQSWCEIMKHEKEMEQLKKNVVELIVSSNAHYSENVGNKQSIVNEIRSFVLSNTQDPGQTDAQLPSFISDILSLPLDIPYEDNGVCEPSPLSLNIPSPLLLSPPQPSSPHLSIPSPQHAFGSGDEDYEVTNDRQVNSDTDDSSREVLNEQTGEVTVRFPIAVARRKKRRKNERKHRCRTCNFSTRFIHVYKQHFETPRHIDAKQNRKVPSRQCQYCGKSFVRADLFMHHQRHVHHKELNVEPIECNLCGKFFFSQQTLNTHMKEHNAVEYCCEQCGKAFLHKCKLEQHVRVIHSELRPFAADEKHFTFVDGVYTCEFCPKQYKSGTHIRGHLKKFHRDLLRFRCPGCDQVECTAGGLVQHMTMCATLNEGRAIKCKWCEETFFHASHLKKHRKTAHPETVLQSRYNCELCGKSYYALNRLVNHKKVCTGIKAESTNVVEDEHE